MRLIPTLCVLAAAFFLAGCKEDAPQSRSGPINPTPQQPSWQFVAGRPPRDLSQSGDEVSFSLDNSEPHMLLRGTGPLSGKVGFKWTFSGFAVPVQGSTAMVSLMIVRNGNNWSPTGPEDPQANYRWYHAGHAMANGGAMDVPFTPDQWRNVYGQANDAEFTASLGQATHIGLAFGDPGAGATAHGVTGSGKFTFTFSVG